MAYDAQKRLTFLTAALIRRGVSIIGEPCIFRGNSQLGNDANPSAFNACNPRVLCVEIRRIAEWRVRDRAACGIQDAIAGRGRDIARAHHRGSDRPGKKCGSMARVTLPSASRWSSRGNVNIAPRDQVLVRGPSGSGNRRCSARRRHWPFGKGKVTVTRAPRQ